MKKVIKSFVVLLLFVLCASLIFAFIYTSTIIDGVKLSPLDKYSLTNNYVSASIYNNDNELITKDNDYIKISEINEDTINAFISIEDKDFYNHNGINYKRIIKAMLSNISSGCFTQGASTISQQLVKNTQLSNEKTIERKIKELYITQELEKEYSKDEILEMYLNVIYFGNSSYGIQNAALNYFGKDAKDLSLSESAVLAGLIKSPGLYSPYNNMEKCIKRRNLVLSEMLEDGVISDTAYNSAINEKILLSSSNKILENYSYRYDYIQQALYEASQILNISIDKIIENEYQIYTYLDDEIQQSVFDIINNEDYKICNVNNNLSQGLITVIDNKTNRVIAFASNTEYDVTNMHRQPGSAIKPIMVYAPAIEEGLINPATKILDEPINIDGYSPQNLGNTYNGYTSIRDCVAYSLNIPAVKIMNEMGIEKSKEYGNKFGISFSEEDKGYALALGGFHKGITLDALTNAYTVFANEGMYSTHTFIKCIKNKYGVIVYSDMREKERVIGEDTAYLMTSILQDGINYGTSKRLKYLPYDIAGKTGTVAVPGTNNNTDAISIAYTTDYSVGCWIGNYTLDKYNNLDSSNNGGTYATSAVKNVFEILHKDSSPSSFEKPDSVKACKINNVIYQRDNQICLAQDSCDDRYTVEDYFSTRYMPEKTYVDDYVCIIKLSQDNNYISFTPNKYYNYQLVEIMDNDENVIYNIEGSSDISELKVSNNATYYMKYKSKEEKKYRVSNKIERYSTPTKNFRKDYNWLFSM